MQLFLCAIIIVYVLGKAVLVCLSLLQVVCGISEVYFSKEPYIYRGVQRERRTDGRGERASSLTCYFFNNYEI